jgi:hypothetical protein
MKQINHPPHVLGFFRLKLNTGNLYRVKKLVSDFLKVVNCEQNNLVNVAIGKW